MEENPMLLPILKLRYNEIISDAKIKDPTSNKLHDEVIVNLATVLSYV